MEAKTHEALFQDFSQQFDSIDRHRHRYEVFRDFVTMSAISLQNSIAKDETLETEYLDIINSYQREDQKRFPHLFALLVGLLEAKPRDALGQLYMNLGISNKNTAQYFSPPSVSELMAKLTVEERLWEQAKDDFITMSEPACGAGGMALALVNEMIIRGIDPAKHLWMQCIDIDRLAALMCYIQLTLWNVPAHVIVGNTLTLEHKEVWVTPQHALGGWRHRLATREAQTLLTQTIEPTPDDTTTSTETKAEDEVQEDAQEPQRTADQIVQFDLQF